MFWYILNTFLNDSDHFSFCMLKLFDHNVSKYIIIVYYNNITGVWCVDYVSTVKFWKFKKKNLMVFFQSSSSSSSSSSSGTKSSFSSKNAAIFWLIQAPILRPVITVKKTLSRPNLENYEEKNSLDQRIKG